MTKNKFELINIEKWADVRDEVNAVNPRLTRLIDDHDPKQAFDFVRIRYRYGQYIFQNGRLQIPLPGNQHTDLDDPSIPLLIKSRLNYSQVPMGIILNKTAEVFHEGPNRTMPSKVFTKGIAFGLWEFFDPPPDDIVGGIWSVIAGARTMFMLPKVSNQSHHQQLQKVYKIPSYQPSSLLQHHEVFSEIANADIVKDPWSMDILFFSAPWQTLANASPVSEVCHFWLQEAWRQSFNCRNNMSFDMAWELFSHSVTKRNIRPKPIIVNTIKHLLSIYDGLYPGYAPAITDDCGPVQLLKEAYMEVYNIKKYPTVMEPLHLSKVDRPVYYSLQFPSLIEYAPGAHGKNIITDFRELKLLMRMLEDTSDIDKKFHFFHTESDESLEIRSTAELPATDHHLVPDDNNSLSFASNSPFLKGCVQITLSENRTKPLVNEAAF